MQVYLPRCLTDHKFIFAWIVWLGLSSVAYEFQFHYRAYVFTAGMFLLVAYGLRQQQVSISNGKLVIATTLGVTLWRRSIPLSELEELFISQKNRPFTRILKAIVYLLPRSPEVEIQSLDGKFGEHGLLGRSDRKKIATSFHLHDYEAEYLLQKLEYWIVRQRPTTSSKMDQYSRRAV